MKTSLRFSARGFTLVELVVTTLVIAVMAALALPQYQRYVYRSHRADAYAVLAQNQGVLERCYQQNFKYDIPPCPSTLATTSDHSYYNVTVTPFTGNTQTYTLTATAVGPQAGDTDCQTLTVTNANQRGSTGSATSAVCWGQ